MTLFNIDRKLSLLSERVINHLGINNLKLSIIESCTGGLVTHHLTNVPGSFDSALRGIVAFGDLLSVKRFFLSHQNIYKYGFTDETTTFLMAKNIKNIFTSDVSVSVTGLIAPSLGFSNQLVGTMCSCLIFKNFIFSKKIIIRNEYSKKILKYLFAYYTLNSILDTLCK